MARSAHSMACLAALLLTTGCAALVVGTGAGVGACTWVKGGLIRSYAKVFPHTGAAVIQSLARLKLAIDEKNRSGSQTATRARQTDGSPVTVTIRSPSAAACPRWPCAAGLSATGTGKAPS